MVNLRQISDLPPELDILSLKAAIGENGNIRDRISRLIKSGDLIGVVPGIYGLAKELRKRPLSAEILANMIYGPSYISFEYALSRAGLIPEGVRGITSATPRRNRDFNSPLGPFSYRTLPLPVYSFGWIRESLNDGSGYLIARPEKALLDTLYRSGAVRSVRALYSLLFDDLRIDPAAFQSLDMTVFAAYAARVPGATFSKFIPKLLEAFHE